MEGLAVVQAYAFSLVDIKPQILPCGFMVNANIHQFIPSILCDCPGFGLQSGQSVCSGYLSVSHTFRAMKKSGKQALHQPALTDHRKEFSLRSVKTFRPFPFLTLNPSFKALRRFNRMADHTSESIAHFRTLVNPYFPVFSYH